MCKLMVFSNTVKFNDSQLETIVKTASKVMSRTEKDGFGISARGTKGIFNRKFLNPLDASLVDTFSSLPFLKQNKSETGIFGRVDALILHGRTSTNFLGLNNTHPISKHDLHLCHNGIVEDSGPAYEMMTQNDTEHIVERFAQGIESVEGCISGYYAFAAFKNATDSLFVVRDSIATLYFAEVPDLNCHVYATTKELILECLSAAKISHRPIEMLEDNILVEYAGEHLKSFQKIKPKGRTVYSDSLAEKSLGRALHSVDLSESSMNYESSPEDIFFDEVMNCADSSWTFFHRNKEISVNEFYALNEYEQLECLVVRSDGTVCSSDESYNGKLFESVS